MSKFKVLKKFRDLEKDTTYEVGSTVELTSKRSKEISGKLGDLFIQPVEEKEETKPKNNPKK
ncbi:hypothetical protein HB816_08830 [Listeria booriae]|uniref:hypothetical protein n=1 Tax=Listeria booriae TaxID=1552123 RepID=UPI00162A18FE|nr:hypothetical protein [Listeria booriae]MBC1230547.1 hypothetical protein [Listeria booriae]MBC1233632.1 hypothetical protein [Listeria booriae]